MTTKGEKLHRPWAPPNGYAEAESSQCTGIRLYNSLVDDKRVLVPSAGPNSRQLTWYSCGPTVYDSAHLGHSRNYVTFDILRRLLQDYFGYNIQAVMNVTDVDDKIIVRARRKHLLQQYLDERPPLDEVCWLYCDPQEPALKPLTRIVGCRADLSQRERSVICLQVVAQASQTVSSDIERQEDACQRFRTEAEATTAERDDLQKQVLASCLMSSVAAKADVWSFSR